MDFSRTAQTDSHWSLALQSGQLKRSVKVTSDFGPAFTKPQNYLLSSSVTVAKGIMLCNQYIVLVIRMEFSPKHYKVSLLLTRKEKNPKKFL